ncbi:ADP-ribose pyrophosphatase [Tessaracoccus lapidicaptus]|uniref:ADP-ribose pyrophosphatase n=1 Tax=Tessaracoccus lapidicaptus TaxID=1427523 RepID=A0A1C0AQX4_9ACTN|nr:MULTISPECIES: NUDIX hydrolase [Tessaracoccus]AQX14912.1 ADP-ribose pyrophosphatase [Tessaracoccus sp. T2.5-30]OCL36757.1 ADP-ribose pyrophosphatase [Tessaracoccus lapidicaptus]VEP39067.1 Methanol dehydrogenase activator [Tessaracoccus lapidicaptus]
MVTDEPMSWPVRSRKVLGEGRVSAFVDEEIETPSGDLIARQYLTHPGAVAVVAWDEEADRIAVLRQYRHPVRMELVEIPAGLLDLDGESWVTAAQRELAEEAELAADRWDVLVDMCTTPGACEESLRIFLARDLRPASRPDGFVLEGEEAHMSWDWVDRGELVAAILDGRCQSPTLVAGVLALETSRLAGRLQGLRSPDADWPIRR